MADSSYHHTQRTRYSLDEARSAIGKRASITLDGTIVEVRDLPAGACVVLKFDERYGLMLTRIGGDLELFDLHHEVE